MTKENYESDYVKTFVSLFPEKSKLKILFKTVTIAENMSISKCEENTDYSLK